MKQFHTGLVVGKFSPLHLGHELLIRTAMAACNETIIISYSEPELPGCDSCLREQWLRMRFPDAILLVLHNDQHTLPQNDADASVHRQLMGWACEHLLHRRPDAVFTSEDYGDGFAAELSRYFGGRPVLLRIGETQQQRERELRQQAKRFLFCDTSVLTTLFYSREMFGRAQPALERMAGQAYDYTFLCAPDFDFVQDGTRREDSFRQQQHAWYLAELDRRRIPYILLSGSIQQRIATVLAHLK